MEINKNTKFSDVIIAVLAVITMFLVVRLQNYVILNPIAIHMWAQCDRASVALNFYQGNMNIFTPSTHHTNGGSGITGMEFPLINYIVAILYKLLGPNDIIYRFVMMIVTGIGLIFAILLAKKLLNSIWLGVIIVGFWYFTPVLTYYTPNYIPDMASLALLMIFWWSIFKVWNEENASVFSKSVLLICATLACLIKISALINFFTALIITVIDLVFVRKNKKSKFDIKNHFFVKIALACAVFTTCLWYAYANHLSRSNNNYIFLLKFKPAESWNEFMTSVNMGYINFKEFYFNESQIGLYFLLFIFMIFQLKKISLILFSITCLLLTGNLIFGSLMIKQFVDHDYYTITLFPILFFLLIISVNRINTYFKKYKFFVVLFYLVFLSVLSFSATYASRQIKRRIVDNSSDFRLKYHGMDEYLSGIGITNNDLVISIGDISPNVTLYFMNRKGWTIAPADIPGIGSENLGAGAKAIILPDTTLLGNKVLKSYLSEKIGDFNGIAIYKNPKY